MMRKLYKNQVIVIISLAFFFKVNLISGMDISLASDLPNKTQGDSIFQVKDSLNVPIAFGKIPSWKMSNAVGVIKNEEINRFNLSVLGNALYGKVNGLNVIQTSGEPGYESIGLNIRGQSSYNGGSPIILIDGFENPYDQLSVDEIESITVLKDAASTAMFGMRGANGVILINTKRGRNGKPKISFSAKTGLQMPVNIPHFLGAYDYAKLYNEALVNDNKPALYSDEALENYQNGNDPYLYPNVNWYNEVLKNSSPLTNYTADFSGGNDNVRYFTFLGVLKNEGHYKNTDSNRELNSNVNFLRYNFRSNVDINLTKSLVVSTDIAGRIEDRYSPGSGASSIWGSMARTPSNAYPVYNPDGTYGGTAIYRDNPVGLVLGKGFAFRHTRELQATVRAANDFEALLPGLKASAAVSFSNSFRGNEDKNKNFPVYELSRNQEGEIIYNQFGQETSLTNSDNISDQWRRLNFQFNVDFNRKFNEHEINSKLFYHQDTYVINGNNVPFANQNLAGRLIYSYKEKYIGETTLAYSGSENFAKGNRFGLFPSISAGWIISNEDFLKSNTTLSFLKVRASYGLVGNASIGGRRFPYSQYYHSATGYRLGTSNVNGIAEGSLVVSDVSWEKIKEMNIGLEASLWNKFYLNVDLFSEKRFDILGTRGGVIPAFIGIGLPSENIGSVRNNGIESELSYRNHVSNKINVDFGVMAAFTKSEILEMGEIVRPNSYQYRTGRSVGQPFGLEAIGFFNSEQEIQDSPIQTFGTVQPGDIKYKDQNNDGIIDQNDEVAIGRPDLPELVYAFHGNISYGKFFASFLFQGVANRSVYLNGPLVWAFQDYANAAPIAMGRWTPETAENATYPRLTTINNNNNYRFSSFWQRNGSFLKLRNVEVGYEIPTQLLNKIGLNGGRVFLNGNNLLSFDNLDNYDAENISGYPNLKSYNIGVQIKL
ncbi:TonB-dependent receptor [Echinicola marina]|uniref:SusC/RagA family TonB-linked outer membrane protein n=1 Tax=Echinicola marina TaxID=2859768 RepID=UPI001CF622A2|nr:TonB-dependent receptor [Echinicola marina]UCS91654.1 TonB-dependent receptor [Echinicola marina]